MEYIWIGILLAIGFYIAPLVLGFVVIGLAFVVASIATLVNWIIGGAK